MTRPLRRHRTIYAGFESCILYRVQQKIVVARPRVRRRVSILISDNKDVRGLERVRLSAERRLAARLHILRLVSRVHGLAHRGIAVEAGRLQVHRIQVRDLARRRRRDMLAQARLPLGLSLIHI